MTIEKRGSEKLLTEQSSLCSLTAEELAQVAGGFPQIILEDYFPHGIFPPDLLHGLTDLSSFHKPSKLVNLEKMPTARSVRNGV